MFSCQLDGRASNAVHTSPCKQGYDLEARIANETLDEETKTESDRRNK